MSHYSCLVALPPGFDGDIGQAVEAMLAPHQEDDDRGFWDWWQIGGRWTGYLSDYTPELDPNNIETCRLCGGSGVRPGGLQQFGQEWFDWFAGCNGCSGKGASVKWPTQWAAHPGDIQRWGTVKTQVLSGAKSFYTVLVGEAVAHSERYVPDAAEGEWFQPTGDVEPLLESIPDESIVVVVDYHS